MNILMFSIVPLFPDHDMGGAQKHLRQVALHAAEQGHRVTLIATRRHDSSIPFNWHPNARILPILRFKQPFPAPYDTGGINLASIVHDVAYHLRGADRFYIHDGELLFPWLYRHVPTVVSLRDSVYPETLQGSFQFAGQTLILPSEYARQFYLDTAGRFFPELAARLRVVNNGIDWTRFRYTPPDDILKLIPIDPHAQPILLHPHRPENNKGMWETIEVVERLVKRHGMTTLKALAPRWLGVGQDDGVRRFYERVEAEIAARGLIDNFLFHDWIPVHLLPQYYSLGGVTLSLGTYTELFSNAVFESWGCGTPAVVARVGAHRVLLPEDLAYKVDYGDHDTAAALAADILKAGKRTSEATLTYLRAHYDMTAQVSQYVAAIVGAQVVEPMRFTFKPHDEMTRYRLAGWCYLSARGVYHDYLPGYSSDLALIDLLTAYPNGFTLAQAGEHGATAAQVEAWWREGWTVPFYERND